LVHEGRFAHVGSPYNVDIACFMCHNSKKILKRLAPY
jgi:hypothetical protein